eukprot:UN32071
MRYDCYDSLFESSSGHYAKWFGADGQEYFWDDIDTSECDINDQTWRYAEGTLTSTTYGMSAFPPAYFYYGDTGATTEQGIHYLGDLRCVREISCGNILSLNPGVIGDNSNSNECTVGMLMTSITFSVCGVKCDVGYTEALGNIECQEDGT